NIGWNLNQATFDEHVDALFPQPNYVESIARDEVAKSLLCLCRADKPARTPTNGIQLSRSFVYLPYGVARAGRAHGGEIEGLRVRRSFLQHDAHDLRDYIACALHDDRIADADVLALDLVLVVERCVGDHDAPNGDRLKLRYGG